MQEGNGEQFDSDASLSDALLRLDLPDISQPLPGMTVPLMAHQAIGVAWMLRQESDQRFKGGILADEMGLGKVRFSASFLEQDI